MLLVKERQLLTVLMQAKAQAQLPPRFQLVKRYTMLACDLLLLTPVLVPATVTLQAVRLPPKAFGALTTPSSVSEMLPSTMLHTEESTSEMSQWATTVQSWVKPR